MKGLLTKDICIILLQKRFFLLLMLVGVAFYTFSPFTMVVYLSFIFSSTAIGTISYDQFDNGMLYILCQPTTKKDYVKEKFILCFGLTCMGWLVSTLICIIIMVIQHVFYFDFLFLSLSLLPIAYGVSCIQIPIKLKFEAEKSRIATFISTGFLVAIFTIFPNINLNIGFFVISILFILCIIALYSISVKIMTSKEY
ncbi:MAG: ABC-2 transporter permease [Floccifex sp.]